MPPKFKRHLNDDDVTGSVKSERRNLLEDDSDEEEDFFLRGPSGPRFGPRNDKIKHVQNQVDEVIDVMQENITKVIERGERLDELQDKSESLSDNATAFSNRSKQLRRQMWWRGCKVSEKTLDKSHHGFGRCYPFASDYHSYSREIPYLIW
ncbi:vesicle-associated membrane protein 4 isoform X1 [Suricata suricatta]|uniref:vesicle-associated membrane protein 4 isoform X1 n=2 Tax=Suricata suricatta TaxID=37032 RepID=UPI001155DBD5|nr:vesicle-associated membrane protein 4 isoform X1 [Suricata suricatta]XP_029790895.1 vesicle-associated membrane protein 4 isoform X1 [Suricata suricatta]XP_029790896.1 vesicle-associated membrane protein 4 isoform X1 [Suricata suricatta]